MSPGTASPSLMAGSTAFPMGASGEDDSSARPHNFSEEQQRGVNKQGNGRRIAPVWGY